MCCLIYVVGINRVSRVYKIKSYSFEVDLSHLTKSYHSVVEKLERAPQGTKRLEQELMGPPKTHCIDWLDAQPHYPKFYWQSRDTREEVVALGQLHTFSEPAQLTPF